MNVTLFDLYLQKNLKTIYPFHFTLQLFTTLGQHIA